MSIIKRKNSGFTLLELVVVVGIMGLMSTMAMDLYTDKSNQKRYDLTKKRITALKHAVYGTDEYSTAYFQNRSFYEDTNLTPVSMLDLTYFPRCVWYKNSDNSAYISGRYDKINLRKKNKPSCEINTGTIDGENVYGKWEDKNTFMAWKGPYLSIDWKKDFNTNNSYATYLDGWGKPIIFGELTAPAGVILLNQLPIANLALSEQLNAAFETGAIFAIISLGLDNVEGQSSGQEFEKDIVKFIYGPQYSPSASSTKIPLPLNSLSDISGKYCLAIKSTTATPWISVKPSYADIRVDKPEIIIFKDITNFPNTAGSYKFKVYSTTDSTCASPLAPITYSSNLFITSYGVFSDITLIN